MKGLTLVHSKTKKEPCPICQDRGVVFDEDGNANSCKCVVEAELKYYLGNTFTDVKVKKTLEDEKYKTNLILHSTNNNMKVILKSFLAKQFLRGKKYQWYVTDMTEIVEDYFKDGINTYKKDPQKQLLIIKLGQDTKHAHNETLLKNILEERLQNPNFLTWVVINSNVTEATLNSIYGKKTIEYVKKSIKKQMKVG